MPPSAISAAGSPIPRMSSYRQRQKSTSGLGEATVPSAYCRPARACRVLRGRGDENMEVHLCPGSEVGFLMGPARAAAGSADLVLPVLSRCSWMM